MLDAGGGQPLPAEGSMRNPPYFIRLSVDVDPNGNPVGRHATLFREGQDRGCLFFTTPDPFDSVWEAFSDLLTDYSNHYGQQAPLFD